MPLLATISCMSKPLSAIIISPGCSKSNSPDFSVISWSDIRPPHASETKLTNPDGVHPISIFHVYISIFVVGVGN